MSLDWRHPVYVLLVGQEPGHKGNGLRNGMGAITVHFLCSPSSCPCDDEGRLMIGKVGICVVFSSLAVPIIASARKITCDT